MTCIVWKNQDKPLTSDSLPQDSNYINVMYRSLKANNWLWGVCGLRVKVVGTEDISWSSLWFWTASSAFSDVFDVFSFETCCWQRSPWNTELFPWGSGEPPSCWLVILNMVLSEPAAENTLPDPLTVFPAFTDSGPFFASCLSLLVEFSISNFH